MCPPSSVPCCLSDDPSWFPNPTMALDNPNGLLAFGGDLSCKRLLHAYALGIFPWYQEDQPILWWSPAPRAVLWPADFKVSRSLRKTLRHKTYTITADQAFAAVMAQCASIPRQGEVGTWIGADMQRAYNRLHDQGHAHSIEVWSETGELIGGLYGVAIGRIFFGESMFAQARDASKLAFTYLVGQLISWNYYLIDCQLANPHLTSLGATDMPREAFQAVLAEHAHPALVFASQPKWQLDYHYS